MEFQQGTGKWSPILHDLDGEDGPNTRKQTQRINPNWGKSYEKKHMVEIENQMTMPTSDKMVREGEGI